MMEEQKRKHRKKKTLAELLAEREELDRKIAAQDQAEIGRIGREIRKWSGRETWAEIEPLLPTIGGAAGQENG